MHKYYVTADVTVGVSVIVEADTEEAAKQKAAEVFGGVHGFAGNGGAYKLIGVANAESITYDNEPDWENAKVEDADE